MRFNSKKIIAKISLISLLGQLISASVFAGEIPYTFDNNNQSSIYAFSGVTTPNYLNGSNLDISKSNTGILSWRGNGNGWGIDTNEKGNDKLEINSNEAIGFNLGTGTTIASFRIKHDKDNTHAYENFQFKAFDASYAPVSITTSFDSHDQAKTKVIIKSATNFKYVIMIGSDDGLNILEESDITTGCSGGSTVTSVVKYGYTSTGSYLSGGLLNIAGGNSSIFAGSNNTPKDWGVQTNSSDKMYVNANEVAVFDFLNTSVKANVYINANQGINTQINVKVFDENRVEISGASGALSASVNPTAGSYKLSITAPQAFRYVSLNPINDTNKFTIYDLIDIFDYSCGKMTTDFRLQNQNGPLNEPNDQVKYFIQIGNPGNVDLTGIDVSAEIPADYSNFGNITLPSGAVNHSDSNTLSISGVSIPSGGTGVITYTVNVGGSVANGTTISTNINVNNSAEGVAGGSGTLDFIIGIPNLGASVVSEDINSGSLNPGDIVKHTVTVTNTGTAIGSNLGFQVDYNSGTTFVTGSCAGGNGITFATGSLDGTTRGSSIKSKSITTNDTTGIMTFSVVDLPVGVPEVFYFCTQVKPAAQGDITPKIDISMDGGFSKEATISNPLNIFQNTPPTAQDDTASTNEDTSTEIDVLGNDSDINNDTISIISLSGVTNGTAQINNGNTGVIFTPTSNFYGIGSFVYTISDGNNGTGSAYVEITINSINDAPTAVDDNVGTSIDTQKVIDTVNNDTDLENDTLTLVGVNSPLHGATSLSGNTIVYTPDEGYIGNDTFEYTISDGNLSDTGSVNIIISLSNTAPIATDDATGTLKNVNKNISVLTNDSDNENDTLSIISLSTPDHGQVSVSGSFIIYVPNQDYTGNDSFEYTISDGNLTDTGAVSITIEDTPEITISTIAIDDVVNAIEHENILVITGSVSNIENGNIVSISLNGKTYTGSINSFSYSISIPLGDVQDLLNNTNYTVNASSQNNSGYPALANRNIEVKLTRPTVKILSPLSGSIMISDTISGTGKNVGDQIYITGSTSSGNTFNCSTQVSSTGSWKCNLGIGLNHDGKIIEITAQEKDMYGNLGNDTSTGITIKLTPPPINNDFTPETQIELGTGNVIQLLSHCIGAGTFIDVYNENLIENPTTYSCSGAGDVSIPLTLTGDIEGSTQEFSVKRRDSFGNEVSGDTKSVGIDDNDTISKEIEDAGPNNGDGNGDGIADSTQTNATSIVNSISTKYNALYSSGSDCKYVKSFSHKQEDDLEVKDNEKDYPLGLWDINIECIHTGATADVSIYLDKVYNTNGWTYKKYNAVTKIYTDISNIITYSTKTVGSRSVTVIHYQITDGGYLDDDGVANRFIKDPAGPTIIEPTTTKSSGGGGGGSSSKDSCPNGDYSGSYYDKSCGTKPTETAKTETPVETPKKEEAKTQNNTPTVTPNNKEINKESTIKEIDNILKDYQNKKKRLDEIYAQETKQGEVSFEKLPKVLPKTGTPIGQRVKTLKNDLLNLTVDPSHLKLAGNYNTDINYWKEALPEIDRGAGEIIVTPSNGMVIPVVSVPNFEKDYSELISGREIDVNKYLKDGALKYPGTGDNGYGTTGNPVIFGHSSYFKKDNGRYKTLFQEIISLDAGEPIWVYKKLDDGSYKRYVYIVETSYEINPSQVDILNAGIGRNLTLFTCTPIGNLTGRWVVTAKYFDEEKIALENELFGKTVPKKHKNLFNAFVNKFAKVDKTKQAKIIIGVFRILNSEQAKKIFDEKSIAYFKLLLVQKFIEQ